MTSPTRAELDAGFAAALAMAAAAETDPALAAELDQIIRPALAALARRYPLAARPLRHPELAPAIGDGVLGLRVKLQTTRGVLSACQDYIDQLLTYAKLEELEQAHLVALLKGKDPTFDEWAALDGVRTAFWEQRRGDTA